MATATLADRLRAYHGLKAGDDVGVKPVLGEVKATGNQLVTAIANTAAVDLVDEVVIPEGAEVDDKRQPVYFSKAKAIFYNHDYAAPPIGTFRNAALRNGQWVAQFSISKTPFAQDLYTLMSEGAINGVSIGFIRLAGGAPSDDEISRYGLAKFITRVWRWLELSVTPQPCNPEAWIMGEKSAQDGGFVEKVRKAVERRAVSEDTAAILGAPKRVVVSVPRPKKIVILRSGCLEGLG